MTDTPRPTGSSRRSARRRPGPVLSGGLGVLAIVLAIVALFAIGTGIAIVVDRSKSGRTTATGELPPGHPEPDATSTAHPGESAAATKTATPSATSSGTSDAASIKAAPTTDDPTPASGAPSYLDSTFGTAVLPFKSGALTMKGSATQSGDIILATYGGTSTSGVDVVRVTVKRAADAKAAGSDAAAMAVDYPIGPLAFVFGGRSITQFTTNEDNPGQYPPAISMTWLQGRYAIQVAVIPATPTSVGASREAALELIGDLRF